MDDFIAASIEAKGKSFDEALFNGLSEIGLSIDEVKFEVIQDGTQGFMGIGAKPYIVRLTQRPREDLLAEAMQENSGQYPKTSDRADRQDYSGRNDGFDRGPRPPQNRQNPQQDRRPQNQPRPQGQPRPQQGGDRGDRYGRNQRGGARAPRDAYQPPVDNTPYVLYVPGENGCDGCEFLSGLLARMGLSGSVSYFEEEGHVKLRIDSDAMGILIGHRGETLDSMQYLTGLSINNGEESYRRVTIDTENYRSKREETLNRLARKIASQVKASGRSVALEPMNPYERRILHSALQNSPFVQTHSEGDEPNRRVIVEPKR